MLARCDESTLSGRTYELRPSGTRSLFTRLVMLLQDYAEFRRQRRALLALDDHMLKDIGLNRGEAARIGGKSFDWSASRSRYY